MVSGNMAFATSTIDSPSLLRTAINFRCGSIEIALAELIGRSPSRIGRSKREASIIEIALLRAQAYSAQKKPEEAIKYLDRAALFSPDNPQIIFQQGLVLSSLGRYAEAAIRFESVLRLNPQYSGAAEKLEEMYRKMSAPE